MNWVTRILDFAWGVYVWLCFVLACLLSLLVALFVPGLDRRRRWVTIAVKSIFVMAGVHITIRGADELPAGSCVVVANHASYIDGILLKAYLPARFSFVIKGEMRNIPIAHFLLRRCGSKFVERNESTASSRDARQIVKAAQDGESLCLFPEGTFSKQRGIGRFRPGAFVAAIKGDMPVVPVAISGTRDMMPSGRLLPRRSRLSVDILPAIATGEVEFGDSRMLAEASRQSILGVLDEPDLL